MTDSRFSSASVSAIALTFILGACSGSVSDTATGVPPESMASADQPAATTAAAHDDHAGHDHDDHAGHDDHDGSGAGDHAGHEDHGDSGATAAGDHDGHDHDDHEGHDHDAEAEPLIPALVNPAAAAAGARLEYIVGEENHHFGKVMEGAILNHTFTLKSAGTEPLILNQVKPTCGCTIAKVQILEEEEWVPYGFGDLIEIGEEVRVGATLHTKNKRGHQKSRINLFSNDPRGTIQLGVEAQVDAFFTVNPKHLSFTEMTVGDVQDHVIKINTSRGQKIKLDLVPAELPQGMQAELVTIDPDGEGHSNRWDLRVSLGPDVEEGPVGHSFMLRSNETIEGADPLPNGQIPVYELNVSAMGRISGMITHSPAYLAMGLVHPGQVVSRTVRVTSFDKTFELGEVPVTIVGAQNEDWGFAKYFTTTISPVENENAIDIEVRLDGLPEGSSGSFRGNLVIEVGHATKKTVELPLTGVCRTGRRATTTSLGGK